MVEFQSLVTYILYIYILYSLSKLHAGWAELVAMLRCIGCKVLMLVGCAQLYIESYVLQRYPHLACNLFALRHWALVVPYSLALPQRNMQALPWSVPHSLTGFHAILFSMFLISQAVEDISFYSIAVLYCQVKSILDENSWRDIVLINTHVITNISIL